MRYTSWGKREKSGGQARIPLLIEDGPEELGIFTEAEPEGTAAVGGELWKLSFEKKRGAQATLPDGRVLDAPAHFGRDKRIEVSLDGRQYILVNERGNDWIIDDAAEQKVGQFSGSGNGVRRSILEFEPGADLSREEQIGLSWLVRLVLESRLGASSLALLWTLLLFTVVGLLAFLVA